MNLHRIFGRVSDGTRFLDSEKRAKRETDDDLSTAGAGEFQRWKNRADRFAPRARAFHWGGRAPLFARVPLEISLG